MLILNNDIAMPAFGLGVFQTPPEETRAAVAAALAAGYRHIDTAAAYGNEREVGEAVQSSGFERGEIFLETKDLDQRLRLRPDAAGFREERRQARSRTDRPADPAPGAAVGLRQDTTGLSRARDAASGRQSPRHRRQQLHGRPPHRATRKGDCRAIGQSDRGAFGERDIRANLPRFERDAFEANLALVDLVTKVAERKNATVGQVAMAWLLAQQAWIVPIPGTRRLERLDENLGSADLDLTLEDLAELDSASASVQVQGNR